MNRRVATAECPDVRLWAEEAGEEVEVITQILRPGATFRGTVVDVGGDHIVIGTWMTGDRTEWYPIADELIGSFRFQPAEASPSASPAGG